VEPDRLGEPRLGLAVEIPVDPQVPSCRLSAAALADKEIKLAVPVEIADPGERELAVLEIELAVVGAVNGNTADRERNRCGQVRCVAGSRWGPQPQPDAARRSRERKQNTHRNPPILQARQHKCPKEKSDTNDLAPVAGTSRALHLRSAPTRLTARRYRDVAPALTDLPPNGKDKWLGRLGGHNTTSGRNAGPVHFIAIVRP
jgi:hypothetical protein